MKTEFQKGFDHAKETFENLDYESANKLLISMLLDDKLILKYDYYSLDFINGFIYYLRNVEEL